MDIVVADDFAIIRRGLEQIIGARHGWRIVGEAVNADGVLPILRRQHVDVVILDVTFQGRSGVDLLPGLRAEFPDVPVLMLSTTDERNYAIPSLRAGATGYIQKDVEPDELLAAIELVGSGNMYVSSAVAEQLAKQAIHGSKGEPHHALSARELEVFRLIATGKSAADIGKMLHLSSRTVSTYRSRILKKTGFRSNASLVAYAIKAGLIKND